MNLLRIAARIAGDVVPIERHEKFRTKEQREKDKRFEERDKRIEERLEKGEVAPDAPGFKFQSQEPDPELLEHYEYNGIDPDPQELEAIAHIQQLANALAKGHIGFEWFTGHLKQELGKVGWD